MASKESYGSDYSPVSTKDTINNNKSAKTRSYVRSNSEYELHMREQVDEEV